MSLRFQKDALFLNFLFSFFYIFDGLSWSCSIVPGPGEPGFDYELWRKVNAYDERVWTYLTPDGLVLSAIWDSYTNPTKILDYAGYADEGDFGGSGAAGDAFRYAITRNDKDRNRLLQALEGLHILMDITGVPGLIGRAFKSTKHAPPSETVPLFDDNGKPLPEPKHGVWREDNSKGRKYPGYTWFDDVSKDQYSGYLWGCAAIYHICKDDPQFPKEPLERMRDDVRSIGEHIMANNLNIIDADGRRTEHGDLYDPSIQELPGFNGFLVCSFFKTIYYITGDQRFQDFFEELYFGRKYRFLITKMHLDMLQKTNYNNYHMVFTSLWPWITFETDPSIIADLQELLENRLWTDPNGFKDIKEQKNDLWNMIYLYAKKGGYNPLRPGDRQAYLDALESWHLFPYPPFWEHGVINSPDYCECDEWWCELRKDCIRDRFGLENAMKPLPMNKRPTSNYMAKENPYVLDDPRPMSSVEAPQTSFRIGYWLGRYAGYKPPKVPYRPKIRVAGYADTKLNISGGKLTMIAFTANTYGYPLEKLEIYYQGIPTGISLKEIEENLFELSVLTEKILDPMKLLLELQLLDKGECTSNLWPYLKVD